MAFSAVLEVLVAIVIAAVVIFVSREIISMYQTHWRLPPGPFPWPVVGNLLWFQKNKFSHVVMNEISGTFGPVFTVFLGNMANVVITDPDIGLQILKKHTFAGRPQFNIGAIFKDNTSDIIMADFGKEWEALRKVGHKAARMYAVSPQLSPMVSSTVDRIVARVGEQPFDSEDTFSIMMIAILAQAAFGKKYEFEDMEFIAWKKTFDVQRQMNGLIMIIFFIPIMKHVFRSQWKELGVHRRHQWEYIEQMYKQAEDRYTEGKNESFCDAIITAKKEAVAVENWMLPYLTRQNLMNAVFDLFSAGSDTTKRTLRWIFLLIAKYPDLQAKMRREVNETIADNEPKINDIVECSLVCAFISESQRFRYISPAGVPHKAVVDEEINGHKIPEGTTVLILLHNALNDEEEWGDPHVFRPERFLDADGKYISKPNHYFIPFSDGRRSCPGNKLAFNNMFLIVTRFLQKTSDIQVVGGVTEEHLRGDLSITNAFEPIPFSLCLTLRATS